MNNSDFKFLLHGIDTLQCAYFLRRSENCALDFETLSLIKETLQQEKSRRPVAISLGGTEFLLHPYGTGSGYPFVLENEDFKIQLGEFNTPNFFVTFRSQALWRESAWLLHKKFLEWASHAGLAPYREESLSRVDFCFDYQLPEIDFTEDCFKSRSTKDSQYRENGKRLEGQIGLEKTPELFVEKMVEVFREVRRVLRDDGTLWLNIGDSYATTPPGNKSKKMQDYDGVYIIVGRTLFIIQR